MAHAYHTEDINDVRVYVEKAEVAVNELQIIPRSAALDKFPFDSLALEMVGKAFALAQACLILLDSDLPDEAYGLSRSLVECSMNLRYLTQDQASLHKRAIDFANFVLADKALWLHWALAANAGKPEEQEINQIAQELGIVPDTKASGKHWSGKKGFVWETGLAVHPLDDSTSTEYSKKLKYAVDYFQTSTFVHCSQPGLDNYFPPEGIPFQVLKSSGKYKQVGRKALLIVVLYLHSIVVYALFGMKVNFPQKLTCLFEETVKKMLKLPASNQSASAVEST